VAGSSSHAADVFETGRRHGAEGRFEEAVEAFDDLLARFGLSTEPDVGVWIAEALICKSSALRELKRHEESVAVADGIVARFAEADEPELRVRVARALVDAYRARKLGGRQRHARRLERAEYRRARRQQSEVDDRALLVAAVVVPCHLRFRSAGLTRGG